MNIIPKIKRLIKRSLNYDLPGKYLKIKESDIFLISYPKSGNTWLRFLFGNLIYNDGIDFSNMNERIPDIYVKNKKYLDQIKGQRIIKSHEEFRKKWLRGKVIYIYRDPRDVVVSYYYWYKKFNKKEINFQEFFNLFIAGDLTFGNWKNHFSKWQKASLKYPNKVLLVKYNDLLDDTAFHFKKILSFCKIPFDDELIQKAVKASDFKSMQKLEKEQENNSMFNKTNKKIKFVRSGKSEWEEFLTKDQIDKMNVLYKIELDEFYT